MIRYVWFENQLLLIDYINNDPDDLIEKENTDKIKRIREIVSGSSVGNDIDMFFFNKEEAKRLFRVFLSALENLGKVVITIQQTKVKISVLNQTFSVVAYGGKTGRKSHLVINTDIDAVMALNDVEVEDRVRPGKKKKGSLGTERYEIFIQSQGQLENFISLIRAAVTVK